MSIKTKEEEFICEIKTVSKQRNSLKKNREYKT